ncbi:helix-turn-helix domain-containing protein [Desulforamulus aeronauticus]|uniref:Repressor LexA n=1 Tax=Desulforamulus aeronauticus DSM 10349 TaxID=1121421 RepID=A0A1M6WG18_9FIRM|nr:LexA family transcriptional regulator [Desulforamulus aeronauticus]SHK92732.1 repressor LexA [Desulforamulus aeronauticus DSM 10349]
MNSIGKKIDQIRQGLSYVDFSKRIEEKTGYEISPSSLHKYVTDQRKPSYKMLEVIATYADLPISSFFEENDQLYAKVKKLDTFKLLQKEYHEITKIKEIPIIDAKLLQTLKSVETHEFEIFYPMPLAVFNGESYGVKIDNNSMSDIGMQPGDLIFIRSEANPKIGQTILAKIGSDLVCKRFYLKNNYVVLEPIDPKYKNLSPHEVEILGTVTKLIRDFEL